MPLALATVPFAFSPPTVVSTEVHAGLDVGARANGALRFVDPAMARTGLVQRIGGAWAPTPWLAVGADGLLSVGNPADSPVSPTAAAWVRAARPAGDGVGVAGTLGVHREFGGTVAATFTAGVEIPAGPLTIGLSPTIERRFDPEADPLDLMLPLGVAVPVAPGWHVGAEAVGQDLEDYLEGEEEEAEGGAAWIAAGTVGWSGEALDVLLSPGVGASAAGAGLVARARVGWRF